MSDTKDPGQLILGNTVDYKNVCRLQQSHWNPVNMTEDFIERYDTLNTKGCPEDLIFGDFNDKPIPSTYSDLTNDYDNNGTQINASPTYKEVVEYAFVPNDENNNEDSLASDIDPLKNNIMVIEGVDIMGNENE